MQLFTEPDRNALKRLLQDNHLPVADLDELNLSHFLGCGSNTTLTGAIGLEIYQHNALLRSLVVARENRKTGCGTALVSAIENFASENGVHHLYLLTETAEHFFSQLGYATIERHDAPVAIRHTREFSDLCPQNAITMSKALI